MERATILLVVACSTLGTALASPKLMPSGTHRITRAGNITLPPAFFHYYTLNISAIREDLYNNIAEGRYDDAVTLTKMLDSSNNGGTIADIVRRLLSGGIRNTMGYAYKLWMQDAKEIVTKYFPESFKLIFKEDEVRIVNKKYNLPLKLDLSVDSIQDRLVWGDSGQAGRDSDSFKWRIIPTWNENNIYFVLFNVQFGMYIKLDVNHDDITDRLAWGDDECGEDRYHWYLEPVKVNNDIAFYFINRQYNQGLKMQLEVDHIGDRKVWGHNGYVYEDPERFGWSIKPLM